MDHSLFETGLFLSGEVTHFSRHVLIIYRKVIDDYHLTDSVDQPMHNPFRAGTLQYLLYLKCWIDAVQWHVEDEVRNPLIAPEDGLKCKRRIDRLNQERTDTVELIDGIFVASFERVFVSPGARINTESPAWALDRLSILCLKIYHMNLETLRRDVDEEHNRKCELKAAILSEQLEQLSQSIDELLQDIAAGKKYMKVYKQMKMYNDPKLNPILYRNNVKG